MNYLCHLYLAGDSDPLLLAGNFVGDIYKGKSYLALPKRMAQGVLMHRLLDTFTDTHPQTARCTEKLRPVSGKYAGVAVDMLYDHLLALSWEKHVDSLSLAEFSRQVYTTLHGLAWALPKKALFILEHMSRHDWLTSYASRNGIGQALQGIERRTGGKAVLFPVLAVFYAEPDWFREAFSIFFRDVSAYAAQLGRNGGPALPH